MNRRKPAAGSALWWPIAEALTHRAQRTGSERLACQDFNELLKAGRLRALVRRPDGRELLAASAWNDFYCSVMLRVAQRRETRQGVLQPAGTAVFSRKLGARPREQWFFVWRPDYEEIFGDKTKATTKPPQQSAEEQTKQGAPLKHDWIAITAEVAFREADATTKERARSDLAEAKRVQRWCVRQLKKRPGLSDLREIVKAVRRRFRQPN
jgi:hypothetical protein